MTELPDFIVVGAAKSGTSSLFKILQDDSNCFIPSIKECRYFSQMPTNFKGGAAASYQNQGVRSTKSYINLFKDKYNYVKGDISNDYLYYYDKAINNIHNLYSIMNKPLPKIIILLRNPTERIISMHKHTLRLGSDKMSLIDAFNHSEQRKTDGYAWMFDLKGFGLVADSIKAYKDAFNDVNIYLYEELFDDVNVLNDLKRTLGLNEVVESQKIPYHNTSGIGYPRSYSIHRLCNIFRKHVDKPILLELINQVDKYNTKVYEQISKDHLLYVKEYFTEDICRTEKIIGKSLESWK